MARSDTRAKQKASAGKYDNTGRPIKPGVKYDNTGNPINSKSTPKSTPKPAAKPAAKTPSSTAPVPKGGATLPIKGNSAMASLARSLFTKGVGRLIPGAGLILTAVEVANYLGGDETEASKLANYGGQSGRGRRKQEEKEKSSQEMAERVTRKEPSDIQELKMRQDLENPRDVLPAPASKLKDEGPARSKPPLPKNSTSTVETQSKKPLAKRIMEALGDNRNMKQATEDRKMTEEMEREMMGRKKGGMGQKKKAPVKKAYGGMVKKKQGGSANKVNMKAGFTRRGCSKG